MRLVVADVLFQDPTVPGTTFFATHRDTLADGDVADVTVVVHNNVSYCDTSPTKADLFIPCD